MRSLKAFFTKEHTYSEAIGEFVVVFFTGVANIVLFAGIYYIFGIDPGDSVALKEDFNTSLYFSIITWTTLGYGDFRPLPELCLISALQAILGYLYMAPLRRHLPQLD